MQVSQSDNFVDEQGKIVFECIPKNRFVDVEVAMNDSVTLTNDLPGVGNGRKNFGELQLDLAQGLADDDELESNRREDCIHLRECLESEASYAKGDIVSCAENVFQIGTHITPHRSGPCLH